VCDVRLLHRAVLAAMQHACARGQRLQSGGAAASRQKVLCMHFDDEMDAAVDSDMPSNASWKCKARS
jgi:hypothetical protein